MSQPDFKTMNQSDLRAYFLAHRDEQEAFYAYVDKLHTEGTWIEMPPLQSVEELENDPEFLQRLLKRSKPHDKPA